MAEDDFAEFRHWIQLKAGEIEENANAVLRQVAGELVTRLVRYTPVDTGRARAGWAISLNGPPTGAEGVTLPVRHGRSTLRVPFPNRKSGRSAGRVVGAVFNPTGAASRQESAAITAELKRDISKYKGQGIRGGIYVFNNVPYVVFLNQGHSKQASAHFIERAILESQAQAAGVKILEG